MDLETPFPYQRVGAQFLAEHPQALLADDMGLGKSAQAILAADIVGADTILVICRANMCIQWTREFQRFSPLDRDISVLATGKARAQTPVVVVSYSLVINPHILAQLKRPWDVVILDEAHALKERNAKCTRAIYGRGNSSPGIAGLAKRTWRLTGTPAPNDASELFTHVRSAGLCDWPYWDFVFRYCAGFDSTYGFRITGHKNVDELKALLARFMLRRKKDDVMKELPPIKFSEVTVEKSPVELDPYFYEQTRMKTVEQFFGELEVADKTLRQALTAIVPTSHKGSYEHKASVLTGLEPAMTTLRRYVGMAKTPKIVEILTDELVSNEIDKLVIFAIHKDVIESLRIAFRKFGAVTLYGGTPAEKRQANVDKFQKDPRCRVFIGNVQAAGTGITLTAAAEIAFVEASWVPADNAQAAMRCHRIGQTRPVRVRVFSLAGSSDEEVMRTLTRKSRELTKIF